MSDNVAQQICVMIISWQPRLVPIFAGYTIKLSETDTNNFTSSKPIPNLTYYKIISLGKKYNAKYVLVDIWFL